MFVGTAVVCRRPVWFAAVRTLRGAVRCNCRNYLRKAPNGPTPQLSVACSIVPCGPDRRRDNDPDHGQINTRTA